MTVTIIVYVLILCCINAGTSIVHYTYPLQEHLANLASRYWIGTRSTDAFRGVLLSCSGVVLP